MNLDRKESVRALDALESIAKSLEKIANPTVAEEVRRCKRCGSADVIAGVDIGMRRNQYYLHCRICGHEDRTSKANRTEQVNTYPEPKVPAWKCKTCGSKKNVDMQGYTICLACGE